MKTIVNIMKEELKHAKDFDFAKEWVKKWIMRNIEEGTPDSAVAKIGAMLDTHFKHFKYALAVTPEATGLDNHVTSFPIWIFRHFGKNIYLTLKPLDYVRKCNNNSGRKMTGEHNSAVRLYDEIKAFQPRGVLMTVHRKSYTWRRHAYLVCEIHYDKEESGTYGLPNGGNIPYSGYTPKFSAILI